MNLEELEELSKQYEVPTNPKELEELIKKGLVRPYLRNRSEEIEEKIKLYKGEVVC